MLFAFDIVGLGVVLTTVLPFVRKGYWWVRVWDFPRVQIAVIGLVDLAALLVLGPLGALQAGVAAALALPDETLRSLSANACWRDSATG